MDLEQLVVEVVEVLPGPPEAVFGLLSDVERTGGLGPENVRTQWLSDERGVGAEFRGSNQRGELAWDVPCRVVVCDPPHRFAWTTGAVEQPSAIWSYDLEPVDGGTRVTQVFRHGPGFTYLRRAVDKHPERAQELTAGRAAELERNMRTVLRAAAGLLRG